MKTSVALTRLVIFFLLCVCVCVMFGCGGPPPPQPPTPPPPEPKVAPLRLTEVLPYPVEGESPWIELYNAEDTVVNPGGQRISIDDTCNYTFPDSLIVHRNGYVLLVFDSTREGRDSATSRGDTIQVFYLGPEYAGAMDNRPGFITSYKPKVIADSLDTVVDLVAWGAPPPMDSLSHDQLRHWPSGSFVNMVPSTGIYDPNYTIKRGYSIGVYPGIEPNDRRDWVAYSPANITRGTLNAVPTPRLRNPQPGAVLSREQVAFSWTDNPHDRGWEIQTASDRKFSKHEVRERVKEPHYEPSRAMSLGDMYWRVRAFGPIGVSPFSGAGLVHIVKDRPMLRLEDRISYYIIPELWHLYQRKDTKLLCMEHCSSDLESSPYKWDSPHPEEELIYSAIHGSEYCARACVSMVNHCHGGNLSQDRIAFFDQIQWGTKGFLTIDNVLPLSWRENGLACGKSMCSSRLRVTLEWALDRSLLPSAVGSSVVWTGYSDTTPKPPFDSVRSWLDSDRPIIVELANADGPGHTVVISGYPKLPDCRRYCTGAVRA